MRGRLSNIPVVETVALSGETTFHVSVTLDCGPKVRGSQALLQFSLTGATEWDATKFGLTRSAMEHIGYFRYLDTKPGITRFDLTLTVPPECTELTVGVRTWSPFDVIKLVDFSVLPQSRQLKTQLNGQRPTSLLSVDVEALQGRAAEDHVNRLIHGRFGDGDHGVGRLCDLFDRYGAKGTFFVDFAECSVYGDKPIFEAAELIASRGHDVQLHVHADSVMRAQNWAHDMWSLPSFANMDYPTARRVLNYSVEKYRQCLGRDPLVFRPGAMAKSPNLYIAARECGLKAVSTIYRNYDQSFWAQAGRCGYFYWENGLLEMPLDMGLDPLSGNLRLEENFERLVSFKYRKYVSFLLHSTSLLYRSQSETAVFERVEPAHEEALVAVLEHLASRGTFATHAEVAEVALKLKNLPAYPIVPYPNRIEWHEGYPEEVRTCNICLTPLMLKSLADDVCPYCSSRVRHRVLKAVLNNHTGNIFERRSVCANNATPMELRHFLADASSVVNFDVRPIEYLDAVADAQNLACFGDGQFEVFYSNYVLNHVADDAKALSEMRRVLKEGGFAVIMAPVGFEDHTRKLEDVTRHYGESALRDYGVGSYRDYGLKDLLALLEEHFTVNHISELDPLTGCRDIVFICRAKPQKSD